MKRSDLREHCIVCTVIFHVFATFSSMASAQNSGIAPLPDFSRPQDTQGFYTTKKPSTSAFENASDLPTPPQATPQTIPFGKATAPEAAPASSNTQQIITPYASAPFSTPSTDTKIPQALSQPAQYAPVPFGKASAEITTPVPSGPRSTTSAPVDSVASSSEQSPAFVVPTDPASVPSKDPTEPTAQTTPIFESVAANDKNIVGVTVRALNKVTTEVRDLDVALGKTVTFGNLEISAISCQNSAPQSRPDSAALLKIAEHKPSDAPAVIFNGWMYASSPSLVALENPVYDIAVVACNMAKPQNTAEVQSKPQPDTRKKAK